MGKLNQFHAAFVCSYGNLVMGMLNVWPSYTIEAYTANDTQILSQPMSDGETAMLSSLPSLGAMVGTAIAGIIIDRLGRKKGGVIISLPYVLSWAVISLTGSSIVILAARFFSGIGGGAFLVYAPMFISEIADDSIRGALVSGPITCYCLGCMISYLLGWFLDYNIIIKIQVAFSVLAAILPMTVTESPAFLVRQRREEEAKSAIAVYKGGSISSKVVLEEFSRLKQQILPAVELVSVTDDTDIKEKKVEDAEKEKLSEEAVVEEPQQLSTIKILFLSSSSRRAFNVVFTALSLQVFMGLVPVQVYAKVLFAHAAPNLSSHFCSVLFALVIVAGGLVTAAIADQLGRRFLIITSSVMVAICMLAVAATLQFKIGPAWISAVLILVYCFSFNCGAGSVPYVLLAELFTPQVQGLASMLLIEWVWFLNFVIIAIFPLTSKLLGIHGVFYIFAGVGVCNAISSYIFIPETKGLSNEQIQEALLKRRK